MAVIVDRRPLVLTRPHSSLSDYNWSVIGNTFSSFRPESRKQATGPEFSKAVITYVVRLSSRSSHAPPSPDVSTRPRIRPCFTAHPSWNIISCWIKRNSTLDWSTATPLGSKLPVVVYLLVVSSTLRRPQTHSLPSRGGNTDGIGSRQAESATQTIK